MERPGEHGPESMARRAWRETWQYQGRPESRYDENGMADAALAPWTLEGDDAGDFSNNAGMLTFSGSPDYEMPADANTDNTCMVAVK